MVQYYPLALSSPCIYHIFGLENRCTNRVPWLVFADSAGIFEPTPTPIHNGLSPLGVSLVHEMNRVGMIVDISHTSDATALHVLNITKAPVIWSHSSARSVWNVPRNVPYVGT